LRLGKLLSKIITVTKKDENIKITGVSSDSRKLKRGHLFFLRRGEGFDPYEIIDQLENKAAVFISEEHFESKIPVYVVDSVLEIKGKIAARFQNHPSKSLVNIGITGTNGKTTTSLMLEHVLGELGKRTGYIGTNGITVNKEEVYKNEQTPTTPPAIEFQEILSSFLSRGATYTAIEASSQGLDLGRLNGSSFQYAIFTNITPEHLDYHGTMENYLEAKLDLFNKVKKNGKIIINRETDFFDVIQDRVQQEKLITFGIKGRSKKHSDFEAHSIRQTKSGISFLVNENNCDRFHIPLIGEFNVYNALGVIATLALEGYSFEEISKGFQTLKNISGRMQRINTNKKNIYVDYAHTPDAINQSLKSLFRIKEGKLITVMGASGERDRDRRGEMGEALEKWSDEIVLTSEDTRIEDPADIIEDIKKGIKRKGIEKILDRKKAIEKALEMAGEKDVVAVLGKGHEDKMVVGGEVIPYSDIATIKKILKQKTDL